jgi:ribosomal protein S6E (S10)
MMHHTISAETKTEVLAAMRPNFIIDEDGKRRPSRRCLKRGVFERRWIAQKKIDGVEFGYHATKGWRRRVVG